MSQRSVAWKAPEMASRAFRLPTLWLRQCLRLREDEELAAYLPQTSRSQTQMALSVRNRSPSTAGTANKLGRFLPRTWLGPLIALLAIYCLNCCSAGELVASVLDPAKVERLIQAIAGAGDWFGSYRTMQEWAFRTELASNQWCSVLSRIPAVTPFGGYDVRIVELYRAGPRLRDGLIGALSESMASQWNEPLLLCLGRFGPAAKAAIPVLTNRIEDRRLDLTTRAVLRVVLANVGWASASNLAQIEANLQAGPTNEINRATIRALALVRAHDWVTEKMTRRVMTLNGLPGNDRAFTLLALACFGDRAPGGAQLMRECARRAREQIPYAPQLPLLLLARIKLERPQDGRLLRETLETIGAAGDNHTDFLAYLTFTSVLVEDELIGKIAAQLQDRHAQVQLGALKLLWAMGLRANRAVPSILDLAKNSPDENVRQHAWRAFDTTADRKQLAATK